MKKYKNRQEVPEKYKVDLSTIFASDKEWQKSLEENQQELKKFFDYKKEIENPKILKKYLDENMIIFSNLMELYIYAYILHDVDLKEEKYIVMKNKIESLFSEYENSTSFFKPYIIRLTQEEYNSLFLENKELEVYRKYLDEIYEEKDHVLKENEEKIINTLSETFLSYQNIMSSLIDQEHDYGKIKLENGNSILIASNNISYLKKNPSIKIRKKAVKQFMKKIEQYQNTESALLNNHIKNNCNIALLKNYQSPWQQKLKEIHIKDQVFENLKNAAKEEKKAWQDYYKLIQEVLNIRKLHCYDILLDWNKNGKEYTIEEAESIVLEALKLLGENYNKKLEKIFKHHCIDYCQYPGKFNGGYNFELRRQESKIVMNFQGDFSDILTIAHEAGHHVQQQYINENNPLQYRNTSTFVAEVASLTNEFLVNSFIIKNGKNKVEKLIGIEYTLKTFQNNFFGAVREAEMEQKMYKYVLEGNTITANFLNDLTISSMTEYLDDCLIDIENNKLSWVTRSHYFMDFYLYSYALCVVVAALLANRILKKEKGILEDYEAFLKCGFDKTPKEAYEKLGINIEDKNVIIEGINFFKEQIELYKKINNSREE